MAYPELPPSPTFWRCPKCGNETEFRASGTGHIECGQCGQVSTVDHLLAAHLEESDARPASPIGTV